MSIKVTTSVIVEANSRSPEKPGIVLVGEVKDGKNFMNLPGGGPRKKEHIFDCAVRETLEETGLDVSLDAIVGIYECKKTRAGNHIVRFVFSGTAHGGDLKSQTPKHAIIDVYTPDEVETLHQAGRLQLNGTLQAVNDFDRGVRLPLNVITPFKIGK